MQLGFVNSITSVVLRVKIRKLSDGSAYTGLDHTTSGLIIAAIADNEAATTSYTVTGSTIETVTTLGTFAAPTATKCRFKAVDATNHPGLYEIQLADARWAVSGARSVNITVSGASDIEQVDTVIQLGMVTAPNWGNVQNATATVDLSGTTVRGSVMQATTIATLASQTSFTLTDGSADDNAYNDCPIVFEDGTTAAQKAVGLVKDYTGATKTITLLIDPGVFTLAVGDKVTILAADVASRYIAAACAGIISGAGTGTEVIKSIDGATTRLTATVDAFGNRTAITYG